VSQQSARPERSAAGLIGALIVLVGLVLAWVGLRAFTTPDPDSPVQTVDYARDVPLARKAADFDLLAPPRLPAGWVATSVRYHPAPGAHWHLGVLTDDRRYVGLEQGDQDVRSMVREYVDAAPRPGRPVTVRGQSWSTYTDTQGDLGLVRRQGRTTTLVVGHEVPVKTLSAYAASLR
jgi:hypothetical protein